MSKRERDQKKAEGGGNGNGRAWKGSAELEATAEAAGMSQSSERRLMRRAVALFCSQRVGGLMLEECELAAVFAALALA